MPLPGFSRRNRHPDTCFDLLHSHLRHSSYRPGTRVVKTSSIG
jgi:hypothetical protein